MQPLGENSLNTPAFLGKLWKMVNDPSTDHLISWSPSGNSFIIQNQAQFWYELLPLYYKHNNMSSFVRQLNMYGFHKMSTVENGTMDADKDEIQFTHQYFKKSHPELLRNIKRKATTAKTTIENNNKHDELSKVLTDVKHLRNRQASVDTQLNAMEQENALLWREVAILRQKHLKQQKIVNKLIQFLVTLVQPSRITPVGVKRGYQLMLNESPPKKAKVNSSGKSSGNTEGPTIHELDNELDLSSTYYDNEAPMVDSPATSVSSQQTQAESPLPASLLAEAKSGDNSWPKNQYINSPEDLDLDLVEPDLTDETLAAATETNPITTSSSTSSTNNVSDISNERVFLNPSTQDTLLSNLIKITPILRTEKNDSSNLSSNENSKGSSTHSMAVATRDKNLCDIIKSMPSTSDSYGSDLSNHVEATQNELEQFKDILNGYNSYVDANALLGELNKMPNFKDVYLFNDEGGPYNLNLTGEKNESLVDSADPLVSGSELTPYAGNFDFTELFDDSIDGDNSSAVLDDLTNEAPDATSLNTPQIIKEEPVFPAIQHKK